MTSLNHERREGPAVRELRHVTEAVTERLPSLVRDVAETLAADQPEHASFLLDAQPVVLESARLAVEMVVLSAAENVVGVDTARPRSDLSTFEEVGAMEWRLGRQLAPLLSAYQIAARAAWRQIAAVAEQRTVSQGSLVALGEALFTFVNDVSSATARGYMEEQSNAVVSRQRLRAELVEQLLSGSATSAAVHAAAGRAGWAVPRTAALVVEGGVDSPTVEIASRLDAVCLPVHRGSLIGAIVPDADAPGRSARLAAALSGLGAIVGPVVPLAQLPRTVSIINSAKRLHAAGVLEDDPLFVDRRLDVLIAHRDAALLDALRERVLAPLAACRPSVRQRLEETLTAWVKHWGDRAAVAEDLHIHPQTVRYRVHQLQELFGGDLDDAAVRARLTLCLAFGPPGDIPSHSED